MLKSVAAAALTATFALAGLSPGTAFAGAGATIAGRIVSLEGGLPVANAKVVLEHGAGVAGTAETNADGAFSFGKEAPGVYDVQVSADGYQTAVSDDIILLANESQINVSMALAAESSGIRTIATEHVSANSSAIRCSRTCSSIQASAMRTHRTRESPASKPPT